MRSHVGQPDAGAAPSPLRALLALNALLLALLAVVTFGPAASAQQRARGSYTMAAGRVLGLQPSAVYVVDTVNQELMAIAYNPNTKLIDGIGYRNLAADQASVLQGPPRSGN
jgi:hypothetical protein